jgi:IPT/TIG domain
MVDAGSFRAGRIRRVAPSWLAQVTLVLLAIFCATVLPANSVQQGEVPADAAAKISKVTPNQCAVGSDVTVEIQGQNFSGGAYLSFSSPAVRVMVTERVDASTLRAKLQINPSAKPGKVTLYVSNPAGPAAETTFTILRSGATVPPPTTETETPSAPAKNAEPEVTSVTPSSAARSSGAEIKIKGKRFAEGVKVSFSNPGIQVLGTKLSKSSELTVEIQVAADAAVGETGLFVINPDDSEVEAKFEITEAKGAAKTAGKGETAKSVQAQESFEVFNLGEGISILQNPAKSKGTLSLVAGKLAYTEVGNEVFSVPLAEIKEVDGNSVFGVNTGTFHIILTSGKTYNFMAGTLRPADSQAIIDSLRHAMQ